MVIYQYRFIPNILTFEEVLTADPELSYVN